MTNDELNPYGLLLVDGYWLKVARRARDSVLAFPYSGSARSAVDLSRTEQAVLPLRLCGKTAQQLPAGLQFIIHHWIVYRSLIYLGH